MIEYLLLGAAALGAVGLERLRRRKLAKQYAAFYSSLSTEVQVVLHVANHEAESRRQVLAPMHLAYGLLQDDEFVAAVTQLGGDADALESRALGEIERIVEPPLGEVPEAVLVIAHAAATAHHAQRTATCADLFGHLVRTVGGALFDAAPLSAASLVFLLVHGQPEPRKIVPGERDVLVVLRNDDFTTRELVVKVLVDVFALAPAEAERVMLAANDGGRAVVGRFAAETARAMIDSARRLADVSPLWIGVEPT